jgi:hypothetical protein
MHGRYQEVAIGRKIYKYYASSENRMGKSEVNYLAQEWK